MTPSMCCSQRRQGLDSIRSLLTKKFNLKVLAFVFDNGFISEYAMKNIKHMTDNFRRGVHGIQTALSPHAESLSCCRP